MMTPDRSNFPDPLGLLARVAGLGPEGGYIGLRAGAVDAMFELYDRGYVSQVAVIGRRVFARVTSAGLDAISRTREQSNTSHCGRCGVSTRWDYCAACESELCDCGLADHVHDWLCSLAKYWPKT